MKNLLAFFGLALLSEANKNRNIANDTARENSKLDKEIERLEAALEEAKKPKEAKPSEKKTSYKVGFVEAKRRLRARKLASLRTALEAVPDNAQRFGGTAIVYQEKEVKIVNFTSKREALQLVKDAEDGKLKIVF